MMSSTEISTSSASNDRANQPTFFGIPPETRNAIYDYVFSSDTTCSLTPHALTQVNKQIRHETLAMYHASILTLKIPLHDAIQVARAKRWLAEVDTTLYSVLPDIQFSWTEQNHQDVNILCARQIIDLNKEFELQLAHCGEAIRDSYKPKEAMTRTYKRYIGLIGTDTSCCYAPSYFKNAVKEGKTWTGRRLSWEPRHCQSTDRDTRNLIADLFQDFKERKYHQNWEIRDLEYIIDLLENVLSH